MKLIKKLFPGSLQKESSRLHVGLFAGNCIDPLVSNISEQKILNHVKYLSKYELL